jgi:glucosamine--fructose-6-phosphate aminotransferase (isomerizing)
MCGIFGFVASKPQKNSIILKGLKTLEYRGYDSWGIAVKNSINNKQKSKLSIEKHTGKIAGTKISQTSIINHSSLLGIGHTRWATHGNVTIANAHPHLDCTKTLAVVHNGIIENFEHIKDTLTKRGHKFLSKTDTEVIIHLIEENLKTKARLAEDGESRRGFATSVKDAFNQVRGLNAVVVINAVSKEIIAVKNGSPLIVGIGKDAYFISSDVSALSPHTDTIVILNDNEMAILGESLKILSLPTGKEIIVKEERVKKGSQTTLNKRFKHFLLQEVNDQPDILKNIPILSGIEIEKLSRNIKNAFGTFILGCGTASYAAMAGVYLFSKIAKKHINFATGSEFQYLQDFIGKNSLIIPISQSGETIDVIEPVKNAKEKGATVIPIVNVETSTLSRFSNFSVFLKAGQEKSVVGTKSFTTMVGILLLSAYTFAGKKNEGQKLLLEASCDVKRILSKDTISSIKNLAKKLKKHNTVFTIGRGISYVASLEAALKLKETALIHAEGFSGGELKHGVIALIEKGTPCFVFAPNDETYSDIISNAQEIKARGGYIIGVGPINNSVFDVFLKTADMKEATLISQVIYIQLLAYYLALERGIKDPDKPRNLAKSVTVK